MSPLLTEFAELLGVSLWHLGTVALRVGAFVSVMPGFGERSVSVRIKVLIVISFSIIAALSTSAIDLPTTLAGWVAIALTETLVGLVLGLMLRLFVLALQTAGSIAAQSTSLAQVLGGAAAEPVPAMGYVLVVGGLALALMAGLHVKALNLIVLSYDLFPSGIWPSPALIADWGISRVAEAFSLAFVLAIPFVGASLVYNLILGVINRAMPQLMVAFIGAPLITWGGLFLLFLVTPTILTVWNDALHSFLVHPTGGGQR